MPRRRVTLILQAEGIEKRISVGEGDEWEEFMIGRSAEADFYLPDPRASRTHCRLIRRARSIAVEDLGSSLGTTRNGEPVTKAVSVQDGDVIGIARARLRVEIVDLDEDAAPTVLPSAAAAATLVPESEPARPPAPPPPVSSAPVPDEIALRAAPEDVLDETISERTTFLSPAELAALARNRKAVARELGGRTIIGRDPECDVPLDHPSISRHHAEVIGEKGRFRVRDLGSTNGTFVNGEPLSGEHTLAVGDRLRVGPFELTFSGTVLATAPERKGTRIEVRGVGKQVNDRESGKPIWLLQDIDLTIERCEFVGLLGASGCGKSTFMDTVNGRRPATTGAVTYNGENLYNHFDAFKRGIGYVPQELIFHQALPLVDALRYASRLRLPEDPTDEEIDANIERVLEIVGLVGRERTRIDNLSGGQKKRVSIAMELLSRPTLLFLDEATSGLDLGTEAQMMALFRRLADDGVTTLCITHFVDSLEQCDMVAYFVKGRLAFYGPPDELKAAFGVESIREVYVKEEERTAEAWAEAFARSDAHGKYVTGRATPAASFEATAILPGQALEAVRAEPKRQFRVLTERYVQVMFGDRKNAILMLSLAPIIALFVCLALSGKGGEDVAATARRQGQLCFTVAISMFFIGVFGSIREVVKELAVYRHERFINLEIVPYLASKAVPLAVLSAIQAFEMLFVVHLLTDIEGNFFAHFFIVFPTTVAAMLLGLAISAAVDTADKAILLMLIVLIPQLLFANAFIQLDGLGKFLGQVAVLTYWSHDALIDTLPNSYIRARSAMSLSKPSSAYLGLGLIVVHAAVYAALAVVALRKKDGPYGRPYQIPWIKKGAWVEVKARASWLAGRALAKTASLFRWAADALAEQQRKRESE